MFDVGIRYPRVMVHKTVKHVLLDIERFRIPANTVHKLTVSEPLKEDAAVMGRSPDGGRDGPSG